MFSPLAAPPPQDLPAGPPLLTETFPRFTMAGGDFETARGAWGLRGEVAYFVDDELQSITLLRGIPGATVEGGVGVDRRAGDYRVAANLLVAHHAVDSDVAVSLPQVRTELTGTDVTLVVAADRSFSRETRTVRLFAVHNPADGTTFARAIAAVSLRDNLWLEGSAGLFAGSSATTLGRLTNRDFLYAKLKVYF
jgi:hypothetical protein